MLKQPPPAFQLQNTICSESCAGVSGGGSFADVFADVFGAGGAVCIFGAAGGGRGAGGREEADAEDAL